MKNFFTIIIIVLSIQSVAFAQTLAEKITTAFENLEKSDDLKYGIASLTVLNSNTGEVLYAKNEKQGMAPASTLKTITTATAYSVLGSNFKYETDLLYNGEIKDGVLNGNLIIKGTGDPTLGSDNFEETKAEVLLKRWVDAIKGAGIRKISGQIIADDTLFNGQMVPRGWTWVDMGQYYGAGISALNWRENKFKVVISEKGTVGDQAVILRTLPAMPYLDIINEVTVGKPGTGDQVYAFSAPYSNKVILRGTFALGLKKQIEISLPDGAYDLISNLKEALSTQGIPTEQGITTSFILKMESKDLIANNPTLLDRYYSPTLSQISYWFLKKSINLYGEALLKTIALHEKQVTTTKDASKWEQEFWTKKLGIEAGALKIMDGSGLSPENRLTTMAIARILAQAKKENWFGSYYENIPIVNNIKMKSGTIGGVLGYAGYHTSSDGTPLVFSFLINNHTGNSQPMRLKMFKMLDALSN